MDDNESNKNPQPAAGAPKDPRKSPTPTIYPVVLKRFAKDFLPCWLDAFTAGPRVTTRDIAVDALVEVDRVHGTQHHTEEQAVRSVAAALGFWLAEAVERGKLILHGRGKAGNVYSKPGAQGVVAVEPVPPAEVAVATVEPVAAPEEDADEPEVASAKVVHASELRRVLGSHYNGHRITTLTFKGEPAWIGLQIGRSWEYARGGRAFSARLAEWADELGEHLLKVTGADLDALKALVGDNDIELDTESVSSPGVASQARHLYLLDEEGVYIACMRTSKPAGRKFRKWLAKEVLKPLARGEAVQLQPLEDREVRQLEDRALERAEERKRLEQEGRLASMATLLRLSEASILTQQARQIFAVKAAELATGERHAYLLPPASPDRYLGPEDKPSRGEPYYEMEELAFFFGMSAIGLGKTVRAKLPDLDGSDDRYCKVVGDRQAFVPGPTYPRFVLTVAGAQQMANFAYETRRIPEPLDMAELIARRNRGELSLHRNARGRQQWIAPEQKSLYCPPSGIENDDEGEE